MNEALERGREFIKKAQEKKEHNINAHQRLIDQEVTDKVQVSTKNWKTLQLSHKLDHQIEGPFKVLEQVSHFYQIKLPNSIKVHNVFLPDQLCKAADNPLPGQINNLLPLIEVATDQEQKVQEIIAVKEAYSKLLYQANQVSYNKDLEFYLASDFKYLLHKLQDFYTANKDFLGPL